MTDFHFGTREQRESVVHRLFEGNAASYDQVVAWTTGGLDRRWKERMLRHVPRGARRVLDLACGTGIVLGMLRRRCPDAALVGVDITQDYLALARRRFAEEAADVTLIHGNAETVPLDGTFDAIVSGYIPKYVDADVLLAHLAPHVRRGTTISVHDFGYPRDPIVERGWRMHMWLVKKLGPRVFPAWRFVFDDNLTRLIRRSRWYNLWPIALRRHGWTQITRERLTFGAAYVVSATKR